MDMVLGYVHDCLCVFDSSAYIIRALAIYSKRLNFWIIIYSLLYALGKQAVQLTDVWPDYVTKSNHCGIQSTLFIL